jgi:hypothetical protein
MSLQIDPKTAAFTAAQRLTEMARIFAGALLRLRDRAALPVASVEEKIPPESALNCLEVSGPPRLSVQRS